MKRIPSCIRTCGSLVFTIPLLASCAGNTIKVDPVTEFNSERYLGTWYEIARLDHVFERGLTDVTANYTRRDDGKITVLNKGYKTNSGKLKQATGNAKFAESETTGHLKVSFFGPFYGDYIIFDLERDNYAQAYISGGNDKYLWLLSRTPTIPSTIREDFLEKSQALGYDTNSIIWVEQSRAFTLDKD